MAKPSRHMARQAAVQALYQWQLTSQAPGDIKQHFISDHDLRGIDVEYFYEAVARKIGEVPEGSRILTFCYDTGERYLSIEGLF